MSNRGSRLVTVIGLGWLSAGALGQSAFVNWETPHVHPMEMTPDGTKLLAVNTADNRLEVFDITSARPVLIGSIPVGLDPVSVRARSNTEAWVANHISDSVSIVNLTTMNVKDTIRVDDEPTDVVFAGTPKMAFISCSQANTIIRIDPTQPRLPIDNLVLLPQGGGGPQPPTPPNVRIPVFGEDPRALAVSANGEEVYIAIFESGNRSTILAGGGQGTLFGPNVVDDQLSPYFDPGVSETPIPGNPPNPPPNEGDAFVPDVPVENQWKRVGMIVKKDSMGRWMDDNDHDWTHLVSGANAANSQRPMGWDVVNHDVGVLNVNTLGIRYAGNLMNLCMAMAVNPSSGRVTVVGTDATNEIRFEPNLNGRFLRVLLGSLQPAGPANIQSVDLNPHLTYIPGPLFTPLPQMERERSLGDPRGIAWNAAGSRGYVTGMGSNNVAVIDASGAPLRPIPIEVGEGPTGVVVDDSRNRVYVLNKFSADISVIDSTSDFELLPRTPLYDPTPQAVTTGRKHLYDTHLTSGLGHVSCGSCHIDARMDKLAWDLGSPQGEFIPFSGNCAGTSFLADPQCHDFHPMKGPMTTQTLQDIIGKEPHHWRGDRLGLEEFADAFRDLLGDDDPLPATEMQEFEDFLATIHFPPNPFRNFDNGLPTDLPLPGHYSTGRFVLPAGAPLPNGDAEAGLLAYRTHTIEAGRGCVQCHSLPTGAGPDGIKVPDGSGGFVFEPLPVGPNGEHHLMFATADGSTNRSIKIPHLRNLYEKTGFDTTQVLNTAGFGLLHDGSVDSIARFINLSAFAVVDDQMTADLVAFMLAFGGSDLPEGNPNDPINEPPGPPSQDTHAAVGWQTTLDSATPPAAQTNLIADMIAEADADRVGLVVKGRQGGLQRGYYYLAGLGLFQSDREDELVGASFLQTQGAANSELTFTVVPFGSQVRIGVDRDEDGYFDRDEIDACSDPADPLSVPTPCQLYGDVSPVGTPPGDCLVNVDDLLCMLGGFSSFANCASGDIAPCGGNGTLNLDDILAVLGAFGGSAACGHPCAP